MAERNRLLMSPEDDFAYGHGIPADATWRNLIPFAEFGLGMSPGSGEAMSARDAWDASGRGGNALLRGNLGEAASEYLNMGTGLLGAIPGAGIVARGTKRGAAWMDRNLPEGFNRLLDAVYPADPSSTTNIFAGPTAKTADHAELAKAQELATQGASRDEILQSTGWAKGSDGKWKFEIDDSAARPVMSVNRIAAEQDTNRVYLGRVLDHPQLYEAYPELKTAGVRYEIGQPGASYDEAENMLTLRGPKLTDTQMPRTDVLLHEVQHPIQGKEGFARGGNPAEFADIWGPQADRIRIPMETKLVAEEIGIKDIPWPGDPAYARLKEAVRASIEERSGRPFSFRHVSEGMDEFDWDYGSTMNAPKGAIAEQTRLGLRNLGMDQYNRLAGEVEPRNVQTRMNMPATERRTKGYWETQDVPDDQQIVRFGNSGPQYSSPPSRVKLERADVGFPGQAWFNILEDGNKSGYVTGQLDPNDPSKFVVSNIRTLSGKNTFGPSAMRNLLGQLREHYPEVTHIGGYRATGGRQGWEHITVPISDLGKK